MSFKKIALITTSLLIITACASTNTLVTKKTDSIYSQKSYLIENINDISHEQDPNQKEYIIYFQESLDKALINANFKKDSFNNDTIIKYNISMDEGNRALRYFVGFGAGQAKALIKVNIINNSDQKSLIELDTEATLSIGVFGGDAKGILDNAAIDIVSKLINSKIFLLN